MNNFQYFQVEDFVEDEFFRRWVFYQFPEDESFWQEWLRKYPEKKNTLEKAREVLLAIRGTQLPLSEERINQKAAGILAYTQNTQPPGKSSKTQVQSFSRSWASIAASLILLTSVGYATYLYYHSPQLPDSVYQQLVTMSGMPLVEFSNPGETPKSLTLPDGSVVTLQKNSSLSYPEKFDSSSREVYLKGEGFFSGSKRPG